jgi:hypothetical protein
MASLRNLAIGILRHHGASNITKVLRDKAPRRLPAPQSFRYATP